jgi:hypothetical protein
VLLLCDPPSGNPSSMGSVYENTHARYPPWCLHSLVVRRCWRAGAACRCASADGVVRARCDPPPVLWCLLDDRWRAHAMAEHVMPLLLEPEPDSGPPLQLPFFEQARVLSHSAVMICLRVSRKESATSQTLSVGTFIPPHPPYLSHLIPIILPPLIDSPHCPPTPPISMLLTLGPSAFDSIVTSRASPTP